MGAVDVGWLFGLALLVAVGAIVAGIVCGIQCAGKRGPRGLGGPTGSPGATGADGTDGAPGEPGPTGAAGTNSSPTGPASTATGPAGVDGATGESVPFGMITEVLLAQTMIAQSLLAGFAQGITYQSVILGSDSNYNTATSTYTTLTPGVYTITASLHVINPTATDNTFVLQLRANNGALLLVSSPTINVAANTEARVNALTYTASFPAGDRIRVFGVVGPDSTFTVGSRFGLDSFSVSRIADP